MMAVMMELILAKKGCSFFRHEIFLALICLPTAQATVATLTTAGFLLSTASSLAPRRSRDTSLAGRKAEAGTARERVHER